MSERKTAEVKFRCTPSFKADAQAEADAAGQSLTEYIEASVRSRRNVRVANEVVGGAIESALPKCHPCSVCSPSIPLVVGPKVPPAIEAQWEAQNAALDSTSLVGNAIEALRRPECSPGGKAVCTFAECNGGTTCSPRQDGAAEECCAGHPVNAGTACDDCPATSKKDGAVTAAELKEAGHPNPELGEGLSRMGFETRPGHTWINPGLQPLDGPADDVAPCGCKPWAFCAHKADA